MLMVSIDTFTHLSIVILLMQLLYVLITSCYDPLLITSMFFPNVLTHVMFHTMMISLKPSLSPLFSLLQYFIITQCGSLLTCNHFSHEHLLLHFRSFYFNQPMKFGYPFIPLLIPLVLTYFLSLTVTSRMS